MSHLKSLISDSVAYSLPPIISSVGNLILLPIYTAYLSPSDFGILTMLTVASNIMVMAVWLNLNSGVLRFFHQYQGEERKKFLGTMALGIFAWSLLVSLLFFAFGDILARLFFSAGKSMFYPFMAAQICMVFAGAASIVIGGVYINQRKAKHWSLLQLLAWFCMTALTLYFVVYKEEGAWGRVKSQFLVESTLFFIYWALTFKYISWCFSWRMFKETLIFGLPLLFKNTANFAFQYSDRWILEKYSSLSRVGLYGFSDTVASLLRVPAKAFATAWMPIFYKEATADAEAAKDLTREMSFFWAMFMLSLTLAFCLNIKPLIMLLVNVRYQVEVVYQSAVILALAYFLASLQVFFIYNLGFVKKTMPIFLSSLLAAVVNLALNLSLIPRYGILAAAWATVAAYLIGLLLLFLASQKVFRMSFNWAPLGKGTLLALVAYGASLWLTPANPWASLALNTGLFLLYLAGILALRVVRPAQIKEAWGRVAAART